MEALYIYIFRVHEALRPVLWKSCELGRDGPNSEEFFKCASNVRAAAATPILK